MPSAIVLGGGLAGLGSAAALAGAGFQVDLFETRGFLGGRATSYPLTGSSDETPEVIDNCQHVLLRCCVNLLDFYRRLGVADRIQFHKEFTFMEPGGRISVLRAGRMAAPFHFTESFWKLSFLGMTDKLSIGQALLTLRNERGRRNLDQISMLDWLIEKRQTGRAIRRFWSPVLVSAVNEDLERMAAIHGFQVIWLGFLGGSSSYEMGIPQVPLGDLYAADKWQGIGNVHLHLRTPVERVLTAGECVSGVLVRGEQHTADYYISALPYERVPALVPELDLKIDGFEHSPITGIHLWFDRCVTELPHAALLDRTVQWMFNKADGRYLQLVVSASRSLVPMNRADVIAMAIRELGDFFPRVKSAQLEKAHVVKEVHATFSAKPGMEHRRPVSDTRFKNFFLAGDWTRSGWPATMEGAVRSGYLAAEAVTRAAGQPRKFLLPDIA